MADGLQERLAAKFPAMNVEAVAGEVAVWLRDEAADLRRSEPNATGSIRAHLMAGADRLEILAHSLEQGDSDGG